MKSKRSDSIDPPVSHSPNTPRCRAHKAQESNQTQPFPGRAATFYSIVPHKYPKTQNTATTIPSLLLLNPPPPLFDGIDKAYQVWYIDRMSIPTKALSAIFYKQLTGAEPVREWLLSLTLEERKAIGGDIMSVEYGWPIGMPTVKSLGKGLWEVRSTLPTKIARVFFCIKGGEMILLHGIIKKSQKAPKKELALAIKRMKAIGSK
jgi:phage-related protein